MFFIFSSYSSKSRHVDHIPVGASVTRPKIKSMISRQKSAKKERILIKEEENNSSVSHGSYLRHLCQRKQLHMRVRACARAWYIFLYIYMKVVYWRCVSPVPTAFEVGSRATSSCKYVHMCLYVCVRVISYQDRFLRCG